MSGVGVHQIVLVPRDQIAEVELPDPGVVRHVAIATEARSVVDRTGKTPLRERVVLFVESDPDAPRRKRTFLLLPADQVFTPNDGTHAVWRGVGISGATGAVVCVFELLRLVEMVDTQRSIVSG